jgi:hypothetical protein
LVEQRRNRRKIAILRGYFALESTAIMRSVYLAFDVLIREEREGDTIICSIQGHFEDTTAISLQPTVFRDWKMGRKEENSHGTLRMLFWKTPQSLISACMFLLRKGEKERREQTFLVRGVHF